MKTKYQRPMMETQCKACGKMFMAERFRVLRGMKKCCSLSCRGLIGRQSQPKHSGRKPSHGGCAGGKLSRLYVTWSSMKQRCHSESYSKYAQYGARGIKVCPEWRRSFSAFRDWAIRNGYQDNLQIDRINNDLGYEPSNCRWVTPERNSANRRKAIIFPSGETTAQVANRLGLTAQAVRSRLKLLTPNQASLIPKVPNGGLRKSFRKRHENSKWEE